MRPAEEVTIEFYTKGLPVTIDILLRRAKITTLTRIFEEAMLIEKDRNSLIPNLENETNQPSTSRRCCELIVKNPPEKKETNSFDMEGLQKVV